MEMMNLSMVVLPVPGPPVMTIVPLVRAVFTALTCMGARVIFSDFSR